MLNVAKFAFFLALVLALALVGVGCAINPDWGIRHFSRGLMGGGELRKDWNRTQMRALGVIFAGFAVYLIYATFFR